MKQEFINDINPKELPENGSLLSYVDGSFNPEIAKYAFGCVFILPDGRVYTEYGNGDNPESLKSRNVTGEMLGAMYAVMFAIKNNFRKITICYDYEGIEKWVTGAWKAKNDHTAKYALSMRNWNSKIDIEFKKVAAHTNVRFNELADACAKEGLMLGQGIPPVARLEEL